MGSWGRIISGKQNCTTNLSKPRWTTHRPKICLTAIPKKTWEMNHSPSSGTRKILGRFSWRTQRLARAPCKMKTVWFLFFQFSPHSQFLHLSGPRLAWQTQSFISRFACWVQFYREKEFRLLGKWEEAVFQSFAAQRVKENWITETRKIGMKSWYGRLALWIRKEPEKIMGMGTAEASSN